jgi:sensor c-di-GMP phosphodiesterase-like protein
MREIDLLPEWYKAGKKRKVSYRRQCLVIGGLFLTMILWSFAASCSISAVEGQVEIMQNSLDSHKTIAKKYKRYEKVLVLLSERAERLEKLDTGISISAVFAELSFLATDQILITELEINSEVLKNDSDAVKAGLAKLSSPGKEQKSAMPESNIRYKTMLTGIAASAADVTEYIAKMEKSPYFCLVVPGLLQHMKDSTATKFQINCYVANYLTEK